MTEENRMEKKLKRENKNMIITRKYLAHYTGRPSEQFQAEDFSKSKVDKFWTEHPEAMEEFIAQELDDDFKKCVLFDIYNISPFQELCVYGVPVKRTYKKYDEEWQRRIRAALGDTSGASKVAEQLTIPGTDSPKMLVVQKYRHGDIYQCEKSKLSQTLPKVFIPENFKYEFEKSKKSIIAVSLDTLPQEIGISNLTQFDLSVENAIGTLWDEGFVTMEGKMYITPDIIYRAMSGLPSDAKTSPQMRQRIEDSIRKMMLVLCKIDMRDVCEKLGLKCERNMESTIINGVALPFPIAINGKTMHNVWQIDRMPLVYWHSKQIGQLFSIPRRALLMEGNCTVSSIVIRDYLLKQIARIEKQKVIEDDNGGKPNVLYDGIFDLLEQEGKIERKSRLMNTIKNILDTFKKHGLVKDWQEMAQGVKITPREKPQKPEKPLP